MRRGSLTVIALVAAVAMLSSCSGDDKPGATGGTTTGASATASPSGPSAVEKLTAELLGTTPDDPAVASSQGTVEIIGQRHQLVAEVLEVRANADTTLLRWRLKSATGESTKTHGFWLSDPPQFDSRGITVVDRAGNHVLSPFTYNEDQVDCVCSEVPQSVDADGEPMYALYPPLGASTTTVDITLPGFAAMKDVPVTRS